MMQSLRAWPGFTSVVLGTLGLLGLIALMTVQMDWFRWLLGDEMQHFEGLAHRTHDLTFALLFGTAIVGLLAQLRTPLANVAGLLMALVPWSGLLLAFTLSRFWELGGGVAFPVVAAVIFGGLTSIAAIVHPMERDLARSFGVSRVNRVMVGLVILAAVPLLAFAFTNIDLQRSVTDPHSDMGHYGFMAAFSFTVVGVGLLASVRPDGWRLTAWVAGLLPILLAVISFVYMDATSSIGPVWALGAIAWGVGFVAAAELTQSPEGASLTRS